VESGWHPGATYTSEGKDYEGVMVSVEVRGCYFSARSFLDQQPVVGDVAMDLNS